MTIELLTDREEWDWFVDESPMGMLFHKWDFLRIIEKHSGYTLRPIGIYKGTELIAIFPIFTRSYMGQETVFSPPPRTGVPYLGMVLAPNYEKIKQRKKEENLSIITEDLSRELQCCSARYTYIALAPGFTDIRHFLWRGFKSNVQFTYTLDLNKSLDELWKDLENEARTSLRKEVFTVKQSDDVERFYRIMTDRYQQQGINYPIVSAEYLRDLLQAFPDHLKLFYATTGDEIGGLSLDYMYKGRYIEWMGGVNVQKNRHPNEYMRWHCIAQAKAQGCQTYEISGADVMRLCFNKTKFNPSVGFSYAIEKKAVVGTVAETFYRAVVKKKIF